MKKYGFFLTLLLFVFASCKKENTGGNSENINTTREDAVMVSKGILNFTQGEGNSGIVKIYKKKNGQYMLALEQLSYKSNLDLELFLSKSHSVSIESVKLFSFRCVNSTMYYDIPSSIDVAAFRFVVIRNHVQPEAVASAELQ